jgi:MoxR-like ATPase
MNPDQISAEPSPPADRAALEKASAELRTDFQQLEKELGRVFLGHPEILEQSLTALFVGGHVLLEGVPGLGKTLLVRALAGATGLHFSRVQFTPDLMPADITGTMLLADPADVARGFVFRPGPLFANLVLADEINRASPKTQSALLEAMQENQVTVGGETRPLEQPFFVMATQNPLEMEGTFPLPEAQLDRFFFKILLPYPDAVVLRAVLRQTTGEAPPPLAPLPDTAARLLRHRTLIRQVPVPEIVEQAVVDLLLRTHPTQPTASPTARKCIRYGASPRGGQAILLAAKLRALRQNRFHVSREDVAAVALPALRHRLILNFTGESEGISTEKIIAEAVFSTFGE